MGAGVDDLSRSAHEGVWYAAAVVISEFVESHGIQMYINKAQ